MSACWPLQMPPCQKAVLVSLADNANDQGVCWPSVASVSERVCLSDRSVQRSIAWLIAEGYLKVSDRPGRSTVYQILFPKKSVLAAPVSGPTPDCVSPPPPTDSHPRHTVTPDCVSPHPRPTVTPPPTVGHPTPDTQSPRTVIEPKGNRKGTAIGESARAPALDLSPLPAITPRVWTDYLLHRKRKRAPLTQTALDNLAAELHLAVAGGWTADAALAEAMQFGWTGFRFDWLLRAADRGGSAPGAGQRGRRESPAQERRQSFMAGIADLAHGREASNAARSSSSEYVDAG